MPRKLEAEEQEFCELSWKLIAWKVAYYLPELVHRTRKADYEISDDEYDAHEQRYLTLVRLLHPVYGTRNTLVHKSYPGFEDVPGDGMMEVDRKRPSVQLVIAKLRSIKR